MQWWAKRAPWDGDPNVDIDGVWNIVRVHRGWHDWLDWKGWVLPTRAVIPLAAMASAPVSAWAALAIATATRLVGTENARFVMYGALPLIASLRDHGLLTMALVAAHALTFHRLA